MDRWRVCTWTSSSDTPISDSCYICGYRPPRVVFFALSGTLGNIFQVAVDRLLVLCLPRDEWWVPTTCWTVSYAASITLRLQSHELLVFGPHPDRATSCLTTYLKTYAAYASTIVVSTSLNLWMVAWLLLSHELALLLTTAFSVVWSYYALALSWRGMRLTRGDDAVALYSPLDVSSPGSRVRVGRSGDQALLLPRSSAPAGLAGACGGDRMRQLLAPPNEEDDDEEEERGGLGAEGEER